jgi:hypothetical protein
MGAEGHTRGVGIGRSQTRGCPLGAGPAEEEAVPMLTTVPSAKAQELHRSQRALVAASLLACPSVREPVKRAA